MRLLTPKAAILDHVHVQRSAALGVGQRLGFTINEHETVPVQHAAFACACSVLVMKTLLVIGATAGCAALALAASEVAIRRPWRRRSADLPTTDQTTRAD
jgi:hypothetical protein